MTDRLETWHCPECGSATYYWHFTAPDGWGLIAVLPSLPDISSLTEAKAKALAEHAKQMEGHKTLFPNREEN
jgi:hypothetical protein